MKRALRDDGELSRRDWLRLSAAGVLGCSSAGWLPLLAEEAARRPDRKMSCILLWMDGGPSQLDTFDPKPGQTNAGPVKAISTSVPGIQISEYLPRLATMMEHLALVRSMSTREGDHGRASYVMRTGYSPEGAIRYPTLGSFLSKELAQTEHDLPDYVAIGGRPFANPAATGAGFLGPRYAPLEVSGQRSAGANIEFRVPNLQPMNSDSLKDNFEGRLGLLREFEQEFGRHHPDSMFLSRQSAYERAVRLMKSPAAKAFQLDEETAQVRESYGHTPFGQGCLLARRLVEQGVPFVEVLLNRAGNQDGRNWDSHQDNFATVKSLCGPLDQGWSALLSDLKDRGLLDSTLIVWMGEFGRTPTINSLGGRDHFPAAWSTVLSGAIQGGQCIGRTSGNGTSVADRPVAHADFIATICKALGLDPMFQNMSNAGRPIRLADPSAKPISEVLL